VESGLAFVVVPYLLQRSLCLSKCDPEMNSKKRMEKPSVSFIDPWEK